MDRQQTDEAAMMQDAFRHWQDCTAAAVAGDPEAITVCLQVSTALEARKDAELPEAEIEALLVAAIAALARWNRQGTAQSKGKGRTGTRLQAKPAEMMRLPMSMPIKNTFTSLFNPDFKITAGGDAIFMQTGDTQIRIDCDDAIGFGPSQALQEVTKHGAAAVQTLLGLLNLWLSRRKGAPHNAYLEARASDGLRFMGRKDTGRGGYSNEDLMTFGRRVYLLSRISVPQAKHLQYDGNGKPKTVTLSVGPLLVVEELDVQLSFEDDGRRCTLRFNYHPGKYLHEWVCGEHPQFADVSAKLLRYHPERQKYHILLGFCLLHFDKVNRKNGGRGGKRRLSLEALLRQACEPVPERNAARFLDSIDRAMQDLAADGIIPDLALVRPAAAAKLTAKQQIAQSSVEFRSILRAARSGNQNAITS